MVVNGDDDGRRAGEPMARKFHEATEEERATYRSWLRAIVFFYVALLFVSGVVIATSSGTGRSPMTDRSVQTTVTTALAK